MSSHAAVKFIGAAFLLVFATVALMRATDAPAALAAEPPGVTASPATTPPSPQIARLRLSFAPIGLADEPAPIIDNSPVIVLPRFEVRDDRIPLSKRDVATSKELLAQAKQRYLSQSYQATFGQLSAALGIVANLPSILGGWHPNDAEATVLFAEDERVRRKRESEDLVELLDTLDPSTAQELRRSVSDTFRHQVPLGTRRRE